MNKSGIISKVRSIMNEYGEESTLSLLSEDTLKLDSYIESVIPDAILFIFSRKETPSKYLYTGNTVGGVEVNSAEGCTVIILPEDFIRFISVRLANWKREIQVISDYGSDEYKKQHNEITRSGVNKPACVYANQFEGPTTIECFPSGQLVHFIYVKKLPDATDVSLAKINDALMASICYMCASLVYDIFENPSTADKMRQVAISLIPET